MSVQRTARRRRKQHQQGFTHLHRTQRPNYSRTTSDVVMRIKKR